MIPFATQRRQYFGHAVLLYLAWLAAFNAVGRYAATLPAVDLTLAVDRAIPFVPAFVWPYDLCYLLPFIVVAVAVDKHRFNRAILAMLLSNATAFVVYLFLPVALERATPGQGLSAAMVRLGYSIDFHPSANQLPSMHVVFAWIAWLTCARQGLPRWQEAALFALSTVITLSTLFIKQHIVLDVAFGVGWAFVAWAAARALYPRLTSAGATPELALRELIRRPGAAFVGWTALCFVARALTR